MRVSFSSLWFVSLTVSLVEFEALKSSIVVRFELFKEVSFRFNIKSPVIRLPVDVFSSVKLDTVSFTAPTNNIVPSMRKIVVDI